jgi:hypothetical protein
MVGKWSVLHCDSSISDEYHTETTHEAISSEGLLAHRMSSTLFRANRPGRNNFDKGSTRMGNELERGGGPVAP